MVSRLNVTEIADVIFSEVVNAGRAGTVVTDFDRDDWEYEGCLKAAEKISERVGSEVDRMAVNIAGLIDVKMATMSLYEVVLKTKAGTDAARHAAAVIAGLTADIAMLSSILDGEADK